MPPTPDVRPPAPRLGLRARWRRSAAGRRATQVRRVLAAPVELCAGGSSCAAEAIRFGEASPTPMPLTTVAGKKPVQ